MSFPRFAYKSLEPCSDSIRFVRVYPQIERGFLNATIVHGSTKDSYTALSYTWGSTASQRIILLDGKVFNVRQNLWEFLHLARQNYSEMLLWIDAICINQEDVLERNRQVELMARIYGNATCTTIWLGSLEHCPAAEAGSKQSYAASDLRLRSMDDYIETHLETLDCPLPQKLDQFNTLTALADKVCMHPYWNRLWIVQELLLSKNKVVVMQPITISWLQLVKLQTRIVKASELGARSNLAWPESMPFKEMVTNHVGPFLATSNLYRKPTKALLRCNTSDMASSQDPDHQNRSMASRVAKKFVKSSLGRFHHCLETKRLRSSYENELVTDLILSDSGFLAPLTKSHSYKDSGRNVGSPGETMDVQVIDALIALRNAQCMDRRDKLYGLHALVGEAFEISVDYGVDVYTLYFAVSRKYQSSTAKSLADRGYSIFVRLLSLGPLDFYFGAIGHKDFSAHVLKMPQWYPTLREMTITCHSCMKTFCPWQDLDYMQPEDLFSDGVALVVCFTRNTTAASPPSDGNIAIDHFTIFPSGPGDSYYGVWMKAWQASETPVTELDLSQETSAKTTLPLTELTSLARLHHKFANSDTYDGTKPDPRAVRQAKERNNTVEFFEFLQSRVPGIDVVPYRYNAAMVDSLQLEDTAKERLLKHLQDEGLTKDIPVTEEVQRRSWRKS